MKRIAAILLSICLFAACEENEIIKQEPVRKSEIVFSGQTVPSPVFMTEGGEEEISFSASDPWTASISGVWCGIKPASGDSGPATIVITAKENDSIDERTAVLTIKSGKATEKITISQKPKGALTLTKSRFDVKPAGGKIEIVVKSNIEFTYIIDENSKEWIKPEETKGLKSTSLIFNISENKEVESREGTITIQSEDKTETVTVSQAGNERQVLEAIYKALGGDNWERKSGWCTDADISTWMGVGVENGHVVTLALTHNNVRGAIPPEIGKLKHLRAILICGEPTYLSGSIPEEICELTEMQELQFYASGIGGEIPEKIGNLKKLKTLSIGGTNLSGKIPDSLYDCTDLQKLDISSSSLSGQISPLIGNLKSLKTLYVSGDGFSGTIPEEISLCTNLVELSFSHCNITGDIPSNLGNLKKLQSFSLHSTKVNGVIPPSIGGCSSLKYLNLSHSELTGEIPESIGQCSNLIELILSNNNLTGSITANIGSCTRLECFDIARNRISGELPSSMANLKKLKTFDIRYNQIEGTFPAWFSELMNNEEMYSPVNAGGAFWIDHNNFYGDIPGEVANHPNFALCAYRFLISQNEGYGFNYENFIYPARKTSYRNILDGSTINMGSEYSKNRYTLIFRYGTDCEPSKTFFPQVRKLQEKYGDKGLGIICSIVQGYNPPDLAQEIRNLKMEQFPHFIEMITDYTFDPFFVEYAGCYSTPLFIIVDNEGKIIYFTETGKMLEYYDPQVKMYNINGISQFVAELFSDVEEVYESKDYSMDGEVTSLQTAAVGAGIDVVLMGDAYSDRLIADGTYRRAMEKTMEHLFTEEPYRTYRDHFNVKMVNVVSKHETIGGETALGTFFGGGTYVGGDEAKVFEYARKALSDDEMDEAVIIALMNIDTYAGTCYCFYPSGGDYGNGVSISYFPTSSDDAVFGGLVNHEAFGHGFAKLDDEYAYEWNGAITEGEIAWRKETEPFGWYRNTDFTADHNAVKWAHFIADERYASEKIGTYEGASTFWKGVWRPTEISIMNENVGGFNAPSREAIYYRIHKLSHGEGWEYDYEDFVRYDLAARKTSRQGDVQKSIRRSPALQLPENTPPVIIRKTWREVAD